MTGQNITLGLSPCPNDTFIFYHLLKSGFKSNSSKFSLTPHFADVEELNDLVFNGAKLPITKVSCFAAALTDKYDIIDAGGALGHNCGPLLVSRHHFDDQAKLMEQLADSRILIPGIRTTAHLLLRLFLQKHGIERPNIEPALYSDILPALQKGEADFGLVIHEERFTYHQYGVQAPVDLGQWWESYTELPIPLGCILVRHDHRQLIDDLNAAITESIDYAYNHTSEAWPFIKENAQALEDKAIRSHIDLYVTEYSRRPGEKGKAAFARLKQEAAQLAPLLLENIYKSSQKPTSV